jgi:hypothetical protein
MLWRSISCRSSSCQAISLDHRANEAKNVRLQAHRGVAGG